MPAIQGPGASEEIDDEADHVHVERAGGRARAKARVQRHGKVEPEALSQPVAPERHGVRLLSRVKRLARPPALRC